MQILFDFDGVLVDSINEVAITSFIALNLLENSSSQATNKPKDNKELYNVPPNCIELFKSNRFHVQPAGDMITLARWCTLNNKSSNNVLDSTSYSSLIEDEATPLKHRTSIFYKARKLLINSNPTKWLELNKPFEPIFSALRQKSKNDNSFKVIILTNKNKSAVTRLLNNYNLSVPEENIYSGDRGVSKLENFAKINARFNQRQYLFIDDSIKNLIAFKDVSSVKPVLAGWGYNTDLEKEISLEVGIQVIEQVDAIGWLE